MDYVQRLAAGALVAAVLFFWWGWNDWRFCWPVAAGYGVGVVSGFLAGLDARRHSA